MILSVLAFIYSFINKLTICTKYSQCKNEQDAIFNDVCNLVKDLSV